MDEIVEPPIIVTGPTGCGKTKLSLELAKALDGEIINIDSVQLYGECPIGSARPSTDELTQVPHHLLEIYRPGTEANVYEYLLKAHTALNEVQSRKKRVLFVGGSTLYIKLLVEGLDGSDSPSQERRAELEKLSVKELQELAADFLTEGEKVKHRNDKVRLIRAIEKGESVSKKSAVSLPGLKKALIFVLCWPRTELYSRIDIRTHAMLKEGLIAETSSLIDKYGANATPLSSIGFAQARSALQGELSEEQVEQAIATETRRYAKRQINFWRNEPRKAGWDIQPPLAMQSTEEEVLGGKNIQKDLLGESISFDELTHMAANYRQIGVKVQYVNAKSLLFQTKF